MTQWARINLELLKTYVRQGTIQAVAVWPENFVVPIKKTGEPVVNNLEDHLARVEWFPKSFLLAYNVGSTIEKDGWYLTSLDYKTQAGESTWMIVVATKKGGAAVYTMTQW